MKTLLTLITITFIVLTTQANVCSFPSSTPSLQANIVSLDTNPKLWIIRKLTNGIQDLLLKYCGSSARAKKLAIDAGEIAEETYLSGISTADLITKTKTLIKQTRRFFDGLPEGERGRMRNALNKLVRENRI